MSILITVTKQDIKAAESLANAEKERTAITPAESANEPLMQQFDDFLKSMIFTKAVSRALCRTLRPYFVFAPLVTVEPMKLAADPAAIIVNTVAIPFSKKLKEVRQVFEESPFLHPFQFTLRWEPSVLRRWLAFWQKGPSTTRQRNHDKD